VPEIPSFGDKLRRIRFSISSTGLRRGLADVGTMLFAYSPEGDKSFDKRFGTDTAGSVRPGDLGITDPDARQNAVLYLPSPARVTRWMLDHIGIDHRDFSFIDLGCGKGRVLLVASHYPFQQIIGVEISPELAEIACVNAQRYQPTSRRVAEIEVRNIDATTADYPSSNLLVHFYHPFQTPLTEQVLSRLEAAYEAQPRRIDVAYLLYSSATTPVKDVFSRFGWLREVRHEQSVLGHYDWLLYSTEARVRRRA
jgi:SAM-dependent methyltransferase